MHKKLKNGKIGVIYSPTYGVGWYSAHGKLELLFDPTIIEMIEQSAAPSEIEKYVNTKYTLSERASAVGLTVAYISTTDSFYIQEFRGAESIVLSSHFNWIHAT